MLGDVGYRVTFFHEQAGDQPFHGMVAKLDPQKDQYGANMIDTYGELLPLFASVGGFDGIPEPLLSMMASGRIGKQPGTEITRVPQSREATLLSGAVFSGAIRMAARVEPIVPHHVFDLRQHLLNGQPNQDSIAQELSLQQQLNQKFFGQASLIE
jgi:hypothetical protein